MIWNAWEPLYIVLGVTALLICSVICWTMVKLRRVEIERVKQVQNYEITMESLSQEKAQNKQL